MVQLFAWELIFPFIDQVLLIFSVFDKYLVVHLFAWNDISLDQSKFCLNPYLVLQIEGVVPLKQGVVESKPDAK